MFRFQVLLIFRRLFCCFLWAKLKRTVRTIEPNKTKMAMMIWQSQSGWIYDDDEDDENDAFCMFHDARWFTNLDQLASFLTEVPKSKHRATSKPSNLYTTEVCSTFFWILASETSSFKASLVGEPRGSAPPLVAVRFVWLSKWCQNWRWFLFGGCMDGCMDGWLDGHARNPISRVFCGFQPFGFPWRYCTPPEISYIYIYMPKKRPPYWKGDTCSIIFQTIIYGIYFQLLGL